MVEYDSSYPEGPLIPQGKTVPLRYVVAVSRQSVGSLTHGVELISFASVISVVPCLLCIAASFIS